MNNKTAAKENRKIKTLSAAMLVLPAVVMAVILACGALLLGLERPEAKKTAAPTPVGVYNAHLKWEKQFGTGYANAVTPPLIIGQDMYIGSGGVMYRLDIKTGKILDSCRLEGVFGYTTITPSHNGSTEEGSDATVVYVPISGGRVGAVDISGDMKPLETWNNGGTGVSESFGEQTIAPVVYHKGRDGKGYLYTGTYGDSNSFVEINAGTGRITRSGGAKAELAKNDHGGFYWTGAYVTDDFVVFGEESVSNRQAADYGKSQVRSVAVSGNTLVSGAGSSMKDGDQIDTVSVEGSVRGSMVHRTESGRGYIYFVSQAKKLYKVELGAGGTFGQTKSVSLSGASVGVPQITGDRAYVGTSAGKVDVIDIDAGGSKGKMSLKYSVSVQGYPQGELLVCSKDSKTDYIYGTYNKKPGGIFFIEAGENKAVASGALYDPLHPEYCISPVECDEDGNLYFKNDSGYIMAITTGYDLSAPVLRKDKADASATKLSWSVKGGAMQFEVFRSAKDGAYTKIGTVTSAAYSDSKTLPGVAYKYKVRGKTGTAYTEFSNVVGAESTLGKPKITTQAGKKKMTVRWKKVTGASGYKIYQATKKKGKFKCVKTIKGQTLKYSKKKLKSKKKYYFRVRAFRTIDGKIAYSAFSNISYKRVK